MSDHQDAPSGISFVRDAATWGEVVAGERSLGTAYGFEPLTRIWLAREGVPAGLLVKLAEEMAVSRDRLYTMLGFARATANRKLQTAQRLSQDESERVLGLMRLIGQAEAIVAESGDDAGFDAPKWVAAWLDRPQPALGGRRPGELMDTAEGRAIVSDLLARMQSGAYA